jgi:hypothetical protein
VLPADVTSSAGLQRLPACGFDRQLQGSEIMTADVGSGSATARQRKSAAGGCAAHCRHSVGDAAGKVRASYHQMI